MPEERMMLDALDIKRSIKVALLEHDMKQKELAELLDVNPQVLNRAIQGDMSPRSLDIRKQVYKKLNI